MKKCGWADFLVAGALAAVVGIILPLQTYLGNPESFPFAFGRLLPELLGIFLVFTAGLETLVWSVGRIDRIGKADKVGRGTGLRLCLVSLLTAALVCVYLESGLLSLGLPELNGGPVAELANTARGVVDACVWGVILAGFLAFARRLRPYLHWISLAVLVLAAAALVDVAARAPGDAPRLEDGRREMRGADVGADGCRALSYEPQPTVVANVKYSPARNILVFVLDSMPGKAGIGVLTANESLRAKFAGFTAYPNNIGMHECTKRGVPGLVTGRHFDPAEISEADYPMTMYGTNSFIRAADAAGWYVAFSPDLLPYGATNLPVGRRIARDEKRRARDRLAFLRQTTEVPFLSLFDTVAFRLSPFLFKGPILYSRIRHAVKGRHSAEGFWGEGTLYPQLAARPTGAETRPFLGLFHSWGAHPPWSADFATTVTVKFQALARLMDAYRASGLYDKSLIVVTTDHGLDEAPSPKGYPSSSSALLLIKPEGAAAPLVVSQLMTSHARIAPLVRESLTRTLDATACERILRDDHPLYRAEIREGGREYFREWQKREQP